MSYQQPPVAVPPPQGYSYKGEYPQPGYPAPQAYQPQAYPPPPQYAQPLPQSNQHAGCLEGFLAGLCCCCVLEACF